MGTNQGWLHAFGEVTKVTTLKDANNVDQEVVQGAVDELWSFLPTDFLGNLSYLTQPGNRHPHMPLAVLPVIGRQRGVDAFGAELPTARDQRQVGLVHAAIANNGMQGSEGGAIAGDEQAAAGIAVQAMHQFQGFTRPG